MSSLCHPSPYHSQSIPISPLPSFSLYLTPFFLLSFSGADHRSPRSALFFCSISTPLLLDASFTLSATINLVCSRLLYALLLSTLTMLLSLASPTPALLPIDMLSPVRQPISSAIFATINSGPVAYRSFVRSFTSAWICLFAASNHHTTTGFQSTLLAIIVLIA